MKRFIYKDPNPVLRKATENVENFDMELQEIIDDMVETMRSGNGIGLAAPQIGISKKIIVCELEQEKENKGTENSDSLYQSFPLTVICNAEIIEKSKSQIKMVEGCLSFPGIEIIVERPKNIIIKGQDRYGQPITIKAEKMLGRVLQHEYDHLNSTLLIDHLKEIDLVLFASSDFSIKTLQYLHRDKQYNLKALVTTSQFATIRGKKEDTNNVKKLAKKLGVKIIEIDSLKKQSVQKLIQDIKADIAVVVDFGLIIPEEVINIFKLGIVNIHPSLLPKYRGSSPIQSTILNGDRYAGVTLILIDNGMDSGPILTQYKIRLKGRETYPILHNYLSELGAEILLDTLPYYLTGEIKPKEQNHNKTTYTKLISKSMGEVFLDDDPILVDRKIRAYDPWPGVYVIIDNSRIQITAAHLDKNTNLIIDRVKPSGKNEMSYQDYINGYKKELTFGRNIDTINSN